VSSERYRGGILKRRKVENGRGGVGSSLWDNLDREPIFYLLKRRKIETEDSLVQAVLERRITYVGPVASIIIVLAWTKDPQSMLTLAFPNKLKLEICSNFGMEMDVSAGRPWRSITNMLIKSGKSNDVRPGVSGGDCCQSRSPTKLTTPGKLNDPV
jgi:hypothetical protein